MNLEAAKRELRRRAIVLEIGGFRPPENADGSWFGRVNLARDGESWPESGDRPMHALCQINLAEMPFRPPLLEDIELITVFIGPDNLPIDAPNGIDWCLRTYSTVDELRPLAPVETGTHIRSFPMRPHVIEEDFPMWDDVGVSLDDDVAESYYDHFSNVNGFKLGGWPTLIQSEVVWAPWNEHPAVPEFVFQIASTEKGNWMWGDDGVGYFGRGTAAGHEREWACQWQGY